jgi:hypothetical protein
MSSIIFDQEVIARDRRSARGCGHITIQVTCTAGDDTAAHVHEGGDGGLDELGEAGRSVGRVYPGTVIVWIKSLWSSMARMV